MTKLRFLYNQFGEHVTGTGSLEPFYQLYGEVRVERTPGSGNYTKTAGYLLDPLPSISNFFVLNSAFRGYFQAPHFNPYAVTGIEKVYHNILKGKFLRSESFGDPPVVQTPLTEVEDYVVLKAGISNSVGFNAGMARIIGEKKFLTWHPQIKTVGMAQPELLHFLIQEEGITGIKLNVKVNYADGSHSTIQPLTLGSLNQWDLLRIPVGVEVLELASLDFTKVVSFYDVWLTDQTDAVISEIRSYELDHDHQPYERLWLYENSLGMPEVFRTVGKSQYRNAIEHLSGRRNLSRDHDIKVPQYFTSQVFTRKEQDISTGPLRDIETAAYMLDFLCQKSPLYELRNGDYFPMQLIPAKSHHIATDEDFNYFLRFQVAGGFEEQSYTP